MNININIDNIDYDSIIDFVLPLLKENAKNSDSIGMKALSKILSMPGDIPKKMLSALSDEQKNDIVISLVNANSEKIIAAIEKSLAEKGITIDIKDIEFM